MGQASACQSVARRLRLSERSARVTVKYRPAYQVAPAPTPSRARIRGISLDSRPTPSNPQSSPSPPARPAARDRPATRTFTTPPRADAWNAVNSFFPKMPAQYGPSAVCADPVTGSSSIPDPGAKKRDTKSNSRARRARRHNHPAHRQFAQRGVVRRKSAYRLLGIHLHQVVERVLAHELRPGDAQRGQQLGGRFGRYRDLGGEIQFDPVAPRSAVSSPLRVWKRACVPSGRWPSCHSTCALATVAWPQRSTSTAGVNQRRL